MNRKPTVPSPQSSGAKPQDMPGYFVVSRQFVEQSMPRQVPLDEASESSLRRELGVRRAKGGLEREGILISRYHLDALFDAYTIIVQIAEGVGMSPERLMAKLENHLADVETPQTNAAALAAKEVA